MLYNNIILATLLQLSEENPSFIVLDTGSKSISASALISKSKSLATSLSYKNFKEGDIALLAIQPGIDFLVVFYALLMLRAKIAIIDPEMGKDNYYSKMKQLSPNWLFADSKLLLVSSCKLLRTILNIFTEKIPRLYLGNSINIISVGIKFVPSNHQSLASLAATAKMLPLLIKESNYECLIIYTSGTLGIPKGVLHTVNSLHESLQRLKSLLRINEQNILGTHLPHFMLLGIASGFAVKLVNPLANAQKRLHELENKKVNAYFGTPAEILGLVKYCEINKRYFPKCLKQLFIGSAPVYKSFIARLLPVICTGTEVICFYGMTEHLMTATISGTDKLNYKGAGDIVGALVPGVDILIEPDGEILVKSTQLYSRYFHETKRNNFHASGDLGQLNADGQLVLLGRKKDMIIRKDFNIYPSLYEDTIRKIPGITEAVFCGVFDETVQDEKVFLVWEGEKISNKEIKKRLLSGPYSIDKNAMPDIILKMQLPRTGRHQKIDKKLLRHQLKTINN